MKTEIENLKKVNNEDVKRLKKLKNKNRGIRGEVSGWKESLEKFLERMNINESNFNQLCREKMIQTMI